MTDTTTTDRARDDDSAAAAQFTRLVEIMRTLRAPGGCPWDREQTLGSLRPFVLEETYELLEAIDGGTADSVREELGDFLFEAIFIAQISEEAGQFSIADALETVCDKLVRRHPHVFARGADDPAITTEEVLERWEVIKAREREALRLRAGHTADEPATRRKTTLSGVPITLPSLLRAYEISARAATVGFDWAQAADVLDKIDEEVTELRREIESGHTGHLSSAEEEMGDLLFALANLSRKLGIEPEAALRRANDKFTRRFNAVERAFLARGESLQGATLQQMEDEWQRVKRES
jgi:MazG family protein